MDKINSTDGDDGFFDVLCSFKNDLQPASHLEQGLVMFSVLVAQAGIVTEPHMEGKFFSKSCAKSHLTRCF